MIFSCNWLKEYVKDLPSPKKLLEELTLHAVEVEKVIEPTNNIGNVVVAELLEKRKHPNADTLNIGLFDVGEDKPRQIVFGGKAVLEVGNKLPIALAPTKITGSIKIEKRKLRGEVSEGMCCLNSELGIFNKQAEVHFFEKNVKTGTPVVNFLDNDYLIDIDNKSMTHRADLFCHVGMAREIAAVFNVPFSLPKLQTFTTKTLKKINITVENKKDCPRYIGVALNVTIGETPNFIKQRLTACNIKSINNVVDITNYVMLEYGQPLHAFAADKISGGIQVRLAKNTESLKTLNDDENTETKLNNNILVIADDTKPLAVAGVIGGKESAIAQTTKRIILEAATFNAVTVRMAAQKIGVRTDSVLRFEKGLATQLPPLAAARAVELLQKYANARITDYTDKYTDYTDKIQINLNFKQLERITGITWEVKQVQAILERLECEVKITKASFVITPPWFRKDLQIPEDIIEEIVRIYGVAKLPEQQLAGVLSVPQQQPEFVCTRLLRKQLASLGLTEVYNYSFCGDVLLNKVETPVDQVEIANPLSEDLKYLRTSLLPRLLETVARNQVGVETPRRGVSTPELALFEIGHVYFADRETQQLAIVVAQPKENSYRVLRGYVEALLQQLHVSYQTELIKQTATCPFWGMYEGKQALSLAPKSPKGGLQEDKIGTVGIVNQTILNNFDIKLNVSFAVLSIPVLAKLATNTFKLKPISAYPAIPLDLSIIVDQTVTWQKIEMIVKQQAGDLLQELSVFDIYEGEKIPAGKKSLAFHMVLQSNERTLAMKEIEQWRDVLVKRLNKELGAELRDK
ncbi:MAG: phenylalanine--tRNA ligase subunit beta [Patescibacteria group bacterium]|jgi:phenylalanyl-tRNA synthetase beta chain